MSQHVCPSSVMRPSLCLSRFLRLLFVSGFLLIMCRRYAQHTLKRNGGAPLLSLTMKQLTGKKLLIHPKQKTYDNLINELDRIYEPPLDRSLPSHDILARQLSLVMSIEYKLSCYCMSTRYSWLDSKELNETIDKWFDRLHIERLPNAPKAIQSIALLRHMKTRYVSQAQIRYLLLKEAALPEIIKDHYYLTAPRDDQAECNSYKDTFNTNHQTTWPNIPPTNITLVI